MDKRFFNLFNLTEDQAIALLDTPQDQISENDSRYIAASHLVNFPTERSIQALIRAVQQTDAMLENRIVRRKAVETLGRLRAKQALPVISSCLSDEDCYTVENAVWAIGEIGTQLLEALHNRQPQFQKSRAAAAIALGELGDARAIPELQRCLDSNIWDLQYAALMALEKLGDRSDYTNLMDADNWFVREKVQAKLAVIN